MDSEQFYKIYKINKSNVITYQLKDMNDEIIKGQFYKKNYNYQKILQENILLKKY